MKKIIQALLKTAVGKIIIGDLLNLVIVKAQEKVTTLPTEYQESVKNLLEVLLQESLIDLIDGKK